MRYIYAILLFAAWAIASTDDYYVLTSYRAPKPETRPHNICIDPYVNPGIRAINC